MSSTTTFSDTLTLEPESRVGTGVTTNDELLRSTAVTQKWKNAWQAVIDQKLIEWGRCPQELEEDDLIPPTRVALEVAYGIASLMRNGGEPAPKRVVPDRDGGIVFERWVGENTATIMVSGDGEIEIVWWIGSKVVETQRVG